MVEKSRTKLSRVMRVPSCFQTPSAMISMPMSPQWAGFHFSTGGRARASPVAAWALSAASICSRDVWVCMRSGESGRDSAGPRLKSAPVQVSFARMSQTRDQQAAQALVAEAESAGETLARVRAEIGKAVFGQERVIELVL